MNTETINTACGICHTIHDTPKTAQQCLGDHLHMRYLCVENGCDDETTELIEDCGYCSPHAAAVSLTRPTAAQNPSPEVPPAPSAEADPAPATCATCGNDMSKLNPKQKKRPAQGGANPSTVRNRAAAAPIVSSETRTASLKAQAAHASRPRRKPCMRFWTSPCPRGPKSNSSENGNGPPSLSSRRSIKPLKKKPRVYSRPGASTNPGPGPA